MLKQCWFVITATLLFYGCGGYKVEDDTVYYVKYNEAQQKREMRLSGNRLTTKENISRHKFSGVC